MKFSTTEQAIGLVASILICFAAAGLGRLFLASVAEWDSNIVRLVAV